jgi:hypothetical protein
MRDRPGIDASKHVSTDPGRAYRDAVRGRTSTVPATSKCTNVPSAVTELPDLAPLSQLPCSRSSCFDQSMMPYNFDSIGAPALSRVVIVALTAHTDSAALSALPIGTIRRTNPGADAGESLDQTSVFPSLSTPLNVLAKAVCVVCGQYVLRAPIVLYSV